MVPDKYQEGNLLIAQQMSLPKSVQKRIIRSDQEMELAAKCATYLSQQMKKLSPQDPSADIQPVFIPYGGILGVILKWDGIQVTLWQGETCHRRLGRRFA
jgi:hypothetical protein